MLYQICGFSNKVIDMIFDFYKEGYYGYYEVIVTLLLRNSKLKIDYINKYVKTKMCLYESELTSDDINASNLLIHPVK